MNPEENNEIMKTEVNEVGMETDEVVGDAPAIIDLVMDGKASEAKKAIYTSLYQKVGERIDAIKPEILGAINMTQEPQEQE
jgi:hypothetical protein